MVTKIMVCVEVHVFHFFFFFACDVQGLSAHLISDGFLTFLSV